MLAKVPVKRNDSKSDFAELVAYISERDDNDNMEAPHDELDPGDRKRHITLLERARNDLRAAKDHLHAARRADAVDAAAVRIRVAGLAGIADTDGPEHGPAGERLEAPIDGGVNGDSYRRSLSLARANLDAATRVLESAAEIDRHFQARARARRAYLAFHAQAAARRHGRDEVSAAPEPEPELIELTKAPQRFFNAAGVACETNCLTLRTAGAEMNAVAAQNVRVHDPVYHVILSWPAGEVPSNEQAFECGAHALRAVAMESHQYVFGVHRDTKNSHLHIAVNRVSPATFKAVYPDRDFYKLDRAMRELELRFGWQHDKGPYAVFERNGVNVIDWRRNTPESKGTIPTPAADMERHADRESLFAYARGAPRDAVMKALKDERLTWQQLHGVLARHGLSLREKGQGFALFDMTGNAPTPIKASDMHEELSKARLLRRLGAFVSPALAPMPAPALVPGSSAPTPVLYDPFRAPARQNEPRNEQREQRRQERADARRDLRARYLRYKAEQVLPRFDANDARTRFTALRNEARKRRAEVRSSSHDRAQRKASYSVIAFETARERERLKARMAAERAIVRKEAAAQQHSFREWVEQQAATGDAAAISQLRGWAHAAKRTGQDDAFSGREANTIRHPIHLDPRADLDIEGTRFRVRRDGSVRYSFAHAAGGFIDHGSSIEMQADSSDQLATLAALIFARRKFGAAFEAHGSAQFKSALHELATDNPTEHHLEAIWHQSVHEQRAKRDTLRPLKSRASRMPSA